MFYTICGFAHHPGMMSAHAFSIHLAPEFRELVRNSGITQVEIDRMLEHSGQHWLKLAGYDDEFEEEDGSRTPLWRVGQNLAVRWGEWGPEHITVPGNACGLNIGSGSQFRIHNDGQVLAPHNVDCLEQKYLLTIVFTEIAYILALDRSLQDRKRSQDSLSSVAHS